MPAVAKLGLIAPFEGPSRSLGYSILYAVQLRIQQWNDTGGTPRVELVALNDNSDPSLVVQLPAQLALDPDVAAVLGPPQSHTAHAIVDSLARLEMPTLVLTPLSAQPQRPVIAFAGVVGQQQAPTPPVTLPPDFPAAYEALAGEPPTLQASLAYAATDELLRQLADHPDRQQLAQVLMTVGQP